MCKLLWCCDKTLFAYIITYHCMVLCISVFTVSVKCQSYSVEHGVPFPPSFTRKGSNQFGQCQNTICFFFLLLLLPLRWVWLVWCCSSRWPTPSASCPPWPTPRVSGAPAIPPPSQTCPPASTGACTVSCFPPHPGVADRPCVAGVRLVDWCTCRPTCRALKARGCSGLHTWIVHAWEVFN